ncbi:MAG: P-II family nitrogen regulator [Planctomycetota bacterium]
MQRLRAVVKTFKADPVCQALLQVGVDEVYVEEVQGYGRQKGHLGLYRQPTYGIAFLPKITVTAYVPDELVAAACKAVEEAAVTGTIGDGKIFLTPVEYAIPHQLELAPGSPAARTPSGDRTVPRGARKTARKTAPKSARETARSPGGKKTNRAKKTPARAKPRGTQPRRGKRG